MKITDQQGWFTYMTKRIDAGELHFAHANGDAIMYWTVGPTGPAIAIVVETNDERRVYIILE